MVPSHLRVVQLVEGAGERACDVGVLGDVGTLGHVPMHNTD